MGSKQSLSVVSLVLIAILLFFSSTTKAITIGFSPTTQSVNSGDPVDVQIVISGLGDGIAPSLGAFDLDVSFDPAIMGFIGVTFGDQLDIQGIGGNYMDASITSPGILDLFEISYDSPADLNDYQAGTFTLATLSFTTIAPGISPLVITDSILSDALGNTLDAELHSGEINVVSVVPEPATLLLAGSGLVGLWYFRKRTRCS